MSWDAKINDMMAWWHDAMQKKEQAQKKHMVITKIWKSYAGKSGGFGRLYLLLDLNQWLSPYESDTLTAESSRSSWVKSEKIEKKRKPTKAQPEFSAGWSAKKEKALSLYEMKQRLAH